MQHSTMILAVCGLFSWASQWGAPEPTAWFRDLFHRDGRLYDPLEIAAIRQATVDKRIHWQAVDYRAVQTPATRMLFGDATRHGRPFAKDPCVIKLGGRYLLYYSMAPSADKAAPPGWAIGIAESRDLVAWTKVGEILPEQDCERNGLVNGKALLLDGQVHLFYNSYGNGKLDAICHAVSDDGLQFRRDPTNPILRATGAWNSGRAIDCEAFEHDGKLWLLFATRDPEMKTQLLVAATAPRNSDFGRAAWTQLGDGPVLQPELPWETKCIEAPSVIKRGDTLYLFYGGGYNNDPQQVGCATSTDGLRWTRLFRQPLLPNGQPGDWNASETGHPGVFQDDDGRTYLFVQGNRDRGHTWFLSCVELGWRDGRPWVMWDSPKFPTQRPGPSAHHENGFDFSAGWTYSAGPTPPGGGRYYHHQAGGTATISWQGTRLALIHKTGPDCGIARVQIDGHPATPAEVDTYSKTVDWQHRTVLASDLSAGQHTAVIEVTGRHHPESSDAYVQVVGFDTAAPAVKR